MTADDVLAEVSRRGLRVEVDAAGTPRLRGDGSQATPGLLRALKAFRAELLELLRPEPQPPPLLDDRLREWKYASGCVVTEEPWFRWGVSRRGAASPRWWRYRGESGWRQIPGSAAEEG